VTLSTKLARLDALHPLAPLPYSAPPETSRWVEPIGERLDFDEQMVASGRRYARTGYHRSDEKLGRATLAAALDADPLRLAQLALDTTLEGCAPERALYLDTEATGLGGGTGNRAFLVGMCWFDARTDAFVLEQLLLRDLDDETPLLERVRERIEAADLLVSYNGKSFDIPLLRARMVMTKVGSIPERPHLDLLHVARRIHHRRGWRMSLGSVERRVLGFSRGPDIAGEEVALRYAHYLYSGDEGCLGDVVTHNRHDVLSLVALLGHYGSEQPFAAIELAAIARVLRRSGDLVRATTTADLAVMHAQHEKDPLNDALWTRAQIAKARGDKAAALADLERLAERCDDSEVRLELAKLYEHFAHAPVRALRLVDAGTGEAPEAERRRRDRLLRKAERNA
jgi:uncharacterized protein YprB with RNaseH-like and TPR domain